MSTETAAARPCPTPGLEGIWAPRRARAASARPAGHVVWLELAPSNAGDHAGEAGEKPPEPPPLAFSEDDVARLCAAAATQADAAATRRLRAREAEERHAAEASLAAAVSSLADGIRSRRSALEAVAVGAALGRSLAWEALGRDPTAVAVGVLAQVLPELREEPEVVVEVAPSSAEPARARVAALAAEAGFPGLLEVRPSAALRAGEVRVAWRDGWAERLLAEVEARAATALAALTGGATPETVEITGADT